MPKQTSPPGTVLMRPMLDDLARNWWLILLRGVCAIIFGVLTILWPGLTLFTLILLYGVFALFDGGLAIGAAIMGGTPAPRWWLALVGVLGIVAGAVTLAWPGLTGLVLLFFIAGWAIACSPSTPSFSASTPTVRAKPCVSSSQSLRSPWTIYSTYRRLTRPSPVPFCHSATIVG